MRGSAMMLHELPPEVLDFLSRHAASPRLIAHLIVVHDVAVTLVRQINVAWPTLTYDQESVLIGAAIHDVGKTIYTNELTGPGNQHE
jgi:HD superfamily phosphodiesterase